MAAMARHFVLAGGPSLNPVYMQGVWEDHWPDATG